SSFTTGRVLKGFTSGNGNFYVNPIAINGDYLYVGTSAFTTISEENVRNYFFKLDKDLNEEWKYDLGTNEVVGGATFDSSGNIYFPVIDRVTNELEVKLYLYSLDDGGNKNWEFDLGKCIKAPPWCPYNPSVGSDDTVYINGYSGISYIYAVNPNGTEKWSYTDDSLSIFQVTHPVAIDSAGQIYFAANSHGAEDGGFAYCIEDNGTNAALVWRSLRIASQEGGTEFSSALAFNSDQSTVYVINRDTLFAFDTSDGSLRWQFGTPLITGDDVYIRSGAAVDENDVLYFGTKTFSNTQSVYYALKDNGASSTILWERDDLNSDFYNVSMVGNNNVLYVGSENSGLHALDRTTGDSLWSCTVPYGADIVHSPGVL
ncbi:MAG: PQQ-binding-like beta-propeller repeat protein, partial [Chlorobiales bacterium]|nr:PQQ-binding-like beta-propeller repeat protein [Chlorobiales bacterium]